MKWVKFWLLGLVCAMLAIADFGFWETLPGETTTPADSIAQQAATLTQQGHQYFEVGNSEAAFQAWREAEVFYQQLDRSEGVVGSRINQSLALQAMGQSIRACRVLVGAIAQETGIKTDALPDICESQTEGEIDFSQVPTSSLNAIGLRNLGNVLRSLGKPEISQFALEQSLSIARSLNSESDIDAALLGLGNTAEALSQKKLELWERSDESGYRNAAIDLAQQALDFYQKVGTPQRDLAQLNRLSLLVDWGEKFPENSTPTEALEPQFRGKLSGFQTSILPVATSLLNTPNLFQTLSPIERVYARLTQARLLSKVSPERELFGDALKAAEAAQQEAENLNGNPRIRSEVLGTLGYVYERGLNFSQARDKTQSALNLARGMEASDLVSQWAWQRERIDEAMGDIEGAIEAYEMAVSSLDSVRQDLLNINSDWQFSFREDVKPIYESYLNLLLRSPQPSPATLRKAIDVSDRFQTAELENFLKCNLVNSSGIPSSNLPRARGATPPQPDTSIATIRIIVLEKFNRAIEIVQSDTSDLFYHEIPEKDWEEAKKAIAALRSYFDSDDLRTVDFPTAIQPRTQALYRDLISPIQSVFPERGTLVFLLDSRLQNIPMAMLQNERGEYLVQAYQVSLNFPARLSRVSEMNRQRIAVFAAGLAIKGESFARARGSLKELKNVDEELRAIQELSDSSSILRDREFTVEKFSRRVQQINFPIVHIATHGQFSSVPEDTFILAYDDKININRLETLLRDRTEGTRQSLDLLVLSACQTAKDDKRGGLGLAGVALRAGANTTLASLWKISDRSTAEFIKEFYSALKQSNLSKAEALRQAQLKFITDPKYTALGYDRPFHWAAFVLLGNG